MRHKHRHTVEDENSDIDMTPMLDIVFIMLIFFIVTASFIKESGIEVNRPIASTSTPNETAHIVVSIKEDGEIWIDKRRVDVRAVRTNVMRLHVENPLGSVIVAADRNTRTHVLVAVVDQIRQAGIPNPTIATDAESR
ncbi:MAG: biopolymer transporter ExbD [Gammaproteobacteria bacterium]|nr:biopolymer transporter ExbD [Gammaproteobacteria bacterium]